MNSEESKEWIQTHFDKDGFYKGARVHDHQ